jgi:hypothetical protein
MLAGGCKNEGGQWGSTLRLWSGTIAATQCVPIGNSN